MRDVGKGRGKVLQWDTKTFWKFYIVINLVVLMASWMNIQVKTHQIVYLQVSKLLYLCQLYQLYLIKLFKNIGFLILQKTYFCE